MRTFVAVWPSREVAARLAALADGGVAGVRWADERNLHVTLRFLGDIDESSLSGLTVRLRSAVAGLGPRTAVAGPATDRFGKEVLHVPVAGLDDVAEAVLAATADLGRPPEPRPFHGHVTLARARGRRGAVPRDLAGRPFEARWEVSSIDVVASELGGSGPRYRTVATIGLGGWVKMGTDPTRGDHDEAR